MQRNMQVDKLLLSQLQGCGVSALSLCVKVLSAPELAVLTTCRIMATSDAEALQFSLDHAGTLSQLDTYCAAVECASIATPYFEQHYKCAHLQSSQLSSPLSCTLLVQHLLLSHARISTLDVAWVVFCMNVAARFCQAV